MDREARDPFELMDNIEEILGIKTLPHELAHRLRQGIQGCVRPQRPPGAGLRERRPRANGVKMVEEIEAELGDTKLDELIGGPENHQKLAEDIELLDGARRGIRSGRRAPRHPVAGFLWFGTDQLPAWSPS